MSGQPDCAAWVREFTGEICVFPACQGSYAGLVRNSAYSPDRPGHVHGVPVGALQSRVFRSGPAILGKRTPQTVPVLGS